MAECINCKQQISGSIARCPYCGTQQFPIFQDTDVQYSMPPNIKSKNQHIWRIALIVLFIAVVLGIIVGVMIGSRVLARAGYEVVMQANFEAWKDKEYSKIYSYMYPEEVLEAGIGKRGESCWDVNVFEQMIYDAYDYVDYKIIDTKHASKKQIKEYERDLNNLFDTKVKISDMYYLTIETEYIYNEHTYYKTSEGPVYKVGDRWYIGNASE